MHLNKRVFIAFVLAIAVLLSGCAGLNVDTPDKKYLAAQAEFELLLKRYLQYYDDLSPGAQATLKAKVNPVFHKGQLALDMWYSVLGAGGDPAASVETYLNIKNQLIDLIAEVINELE